MSSRDILLSNLIPFDWFLYFDLTKGYRDKERTSNWEGEFRKTTKHMNLNEW
jgi:hypothetical protein